MMFVILLLFALLVLTGGLIASLLRLGEDVSPLGHAPLAFSLGTASVGLLALLVHILGGGLQCVGYAFVGLATGLAALCIARKVQERGTLRQPTHRTLELRLPDLIVLALAAVSVISAAWSGPWLSHTADGFLHITAARRLVVTDQVLNRGIYYPVEPEGLDPVTGTWHTVLALLSTFSRRDVVDLWFHLPPLFAPLQVLAFYAFAVSILKQRSSGALATAISFLAEEPLDFRMSAQPNRVAFVLVWMALTLGVACLNRGEKVHLAAAALLAVVIASIHFFFFELLVLLLAAYAGWRFLLCLARRSFRDGELARLTLLIAALLTGALVVLYRLVSAQYVSSPSFLATWRNAIYIAREYFILDPRLLLPGVLSVNALAYALSPFLAPDAVKGKRAAGYLAANLALVPLVIFNPLVLHFLMGKTPDISIRRLVFYMPPSSLVLAYVLSSWMAAFRFRPARGLRRRWATAQGALAVLTAVALLFIAGRGLYDLYSPISHYRYSMAVSRSSRLDPNEGLYGFINRRLPPGAVILSDPDTSYHIAGLTGRYVVTVKASHQEWMYEVTNGPRSRRQVMAVLDRSVGLMSTASILHEYGVQYVVADVTAYGVEDLGPWRKFARLPHLFRLVYADPEARIYEVHLESLAQVLLEQEPPRLWHGVPSSPAGKTPLASFALSGEVVEAGEGFVIYTRWMHPPPVALGQDVTIHLVGLRSGNRFSAEYRWDNGRAPQRAASGDVEAAYPLFTPADTTIDLYAVSLSLEVDGVPHRVPLGTVQVQATYQAEGFSGLTRTAGTRGCYRAMLPGWSTLPGRYVEGWAVGTSDTDVTIWHELAPIPPGDYVVELHVYVQRETVNAVEVRLNDRSEIASWSDSGTVGLQVVQLAMRDVPGGGEIAITARSCDPAEVIIDEVVIRPMSDQLPAFGTGDR
ncbi:MAG TPA: hypothetical protein EYP49_13205 [Anaerolineae bacterium]|nr:hypothetical protein [Anaerolineae bacterium]